MISLRGASRLVGLAVCAGLIGLTLAVFAATQAEPKRYAILVGINQYQHEKLKPLRFAENDARDMAAFLERHGYEVALLLGSARDEKDQPSRANVEASIHEILRRCKKGDLVVVGLAGHGLQFEKQPDCFFCPVDARPFAESTESLVSLGKIYKEMEQSFAGVKVLLVDACRDDPRQSESRGRRGIDADTAPKPPDGVAALFSCRQGEFAFEHQKLGHGVFFHYVLEGLRGAAQDSDGEVTFETLASFVRKRVAMEVPKLIGEGAQQSPNMKGDLAGLSLALVKLDSTSRPEEPPAKARVERKQPERPSVEIREAKKRALAKSRQVAKQPERPSAEIRESPKTMEVELGSGVKLQMVRIPAGKFLMGSPQDEEGRNDSEGPQHEVTISRAFYLGKFEMTQEQYETVMGKNPSHFKGMGTEKTEGKKRSKKKSKKGSSGDSGEEGSAPRGETTSESWRRLPVENVSWEDAISVCARLNEQNSQKGWRFDLPTEAQWEYACRARTTTPFHFGDQLTRNRANIDVNTGRTRVVGSYEPNAWGLYDMHGNVWEWCKDWYGPYASGSQTDPTRSETGPDRVYRGGGWLHVPYGCRSALRRWNAPDYRDAELGFRLALVPSGGE